MGQPDWTLFSNTRDPQGFNFGDTKDDPTWIGDFTAVGYDQVLFYSPSDGHWWLGSFDTGKGQLNWTLISNTRDPQGFNFGDTKDDPTWIGDFTAVGYDQVLFYSPSDGHWWLGSFDTGKGQLNWTLISNTRDPQGFNFGDTRDDPTWIGDFTAVGYDQVLFYSPFDGHWWLGSFDIGKG